MRLLITTQTVDRDDPILGFFHGWVTEFAKHFESIEVICLREGVHSLPDNVSVHSLGKEHGENRLKYLVRFYRFFWSAYMTKHADFIFFHMGAICNVLALPFFIIRKIRRTRFLWWKTHGKVGKPLERLALMGVDRVFTAGSKSFAIQTNKRIVVGHAIDAGQFRPSENTVIGGTSALITVGRIVPIKRIEVALEVMRTLKAREKMQEYELSLIGIADSKDYEKSLRDFCIREKLDTVHFIGSINHAELPRLYQKSSILIHPAFEAGFDKVVLEAMASEVIPLTSILSFKEILEPYGLYIAPNDVEAYVEGIIRIQNMSTDERTKLQSVLRALVVEHHSLETLPKRIFGV